MTGRSSPPPSRWIAAAAALGAAGIVVALAVWLAGTGGSPEAADPGPVHVHALGLNPADGALFIATHEGLYRVAPDQAKAERVGDLRQDTMGFTVAGPDHFLGSGHPDAVAASEQGLPAHLGLIQSTDAGKTWKPVSLLGEADFHVLRLAGGRLYGYDATNGRLLVSATGGTSWEELEKPGSLVDIAVDPDDADHLVAASVGGAGDGLYASTDAGATWERRSDGVGLLGWPARERLFLVTGDGSVLVSGDGGKTFDRAGEIGAEPAAFLAHAADELYVAHHDGTIEVSRDDGVTWTKRSAP
jgi:hypothetical protein